MSANQHLDKQINGNRTGPSKHEIAQIIPIYKSKEKNKTNILTTINLENFGKQFIKGYMAFVKLGIFFMITNTDFGRDIPQ